MTRLELLDRLHQIRTETLEVLTGGDLNSEPDVLKEPLARKIDTLLEDINDEGVLDVQCPPDIAIRMNLPRPA